MEKKVIVARIEVLKGKEKDFLAIVPALIEGTRNEEGNLIYTLYQNPFNESEFIFYEEYKDQDAIRKHGSNAHFQDFAKNVQPLLAKEMDIQTF
ncbi:putative quinol monooxygenase [Bacteroides sp. 519]|uniref:putative quinol monooxygenase n=1 Tax=Bacteroides sp. 519 TaxID=2302937 RepID=UPI0013D288D2|nr:putative quinol monooxygenase [Bacteroides sp. 519]NDV57818.1 antibiotic biosynthesis monooxygenase [Bacteroides sp. 519]